MARARSQGRFFVVCPFFPACAKHLPPRVRNTSCIKQSSCWLRYISRKFWEIFLLFRQRILRHTCRVGWLRFLVLECLFHSPRASSNLVYGFVAVLRRELLNVIFAFSHGVAPGVVAEISFPLLPVSAFCLCQGVRYSLAEPGQVGLTSCADQATGMGLNKSRYRTSMEPYSGLALTVSVTERGLLLPPF